MSDASQITRKAKSNLAFALQILPKDKREDMVTFYAFCRTVDDLADKSEPSLEERTAALNAWQAGLASGFENPDALQKQIVELRDRRKIPNELLAAIIEGCQMDLQPQRFETWEELSGYVWKVACAVGLVSIRLFGCQSPDSEAYAEALGRALQLTNILRDIGEDFSNGGRIYLPLEDLAQFGYSAEALEKHEYNESFFRLMSYEANRAESFFLEATQLLPKSDRKALSPARIMARIYQNLLETMRRDNFQVFDKRYSVPKFAKFTILAKHLIAG